ncbi:MAG TPA: pyrroline-5-carboxylate reductase [Steroidobacteraceae bacterium]|jgi:pyrroline-5-carboxylate reductase|nr:pyrroline-5-carboxylate reductase [Steroidobacteraceae bacterium]
MTLMQPQVPERIAFIGGGNMARALIGGLIRQRVPAGHISVGEPDAALAEGLRREYGIRVDADNERAVQGAQLVVLAVKPQHAAAALQSVRASLSGGRPLLLSIAAGLRIQDIARSCPPGIAIVRAMPNRPALVGAGVTGMYAHPDVTRSQRDYAELIGKASGRSVWLHAEDHLDIVTALSGSGPAYFFLLAEEMARAAERLGLGRDTAQALAAGTLYGAGLLAAENGTLAQQRVAVTSKGGTTEAALRVFEQGGLSRLVADAIEAATARSVELAGALRTVSGATP